jgi:hypothetical protein
MGKHDEAMAAIIGKAMLQPELRRQILADPSSVNLPAEYREKLIEGLREIEVGGVASARVPQKFGTNAWGVGGSIA